jgi:hypothetical protein
MGPLDADLLPLIAPRSSHRKKTGVGAMDSGHCPHRRGAGPLFLRYLHLGSSTKTWLFFAPLFFDFCLSPSVALLDFLNRIFGRFVTRGVQKRDKRNHGNYPQPPKKVQSTLKLKVAAYCV